MENVTKWFRIYSWLNLIFISRTIYEYIYKFKSINLQSFILSLLNHVHKIKTTD